MTDKKIINPIDIDKISETPHSIEYPHHVGSTPIKPEDIGKEKGLSISSMEHQTDQQLELIYEQMNLLAKQAKKIQFRKEVSEFIYQADYKFIPVINHVYYLYKNESEQPILSLLSPKQWSQSRTSKHYIHLATVKLLGDHTWDILESPNLYFNNK